MEFWILNIFWKYLMPRIVHKLRMWDFLAAKRVDYFIANSINTSNRISKYYKRDSSVIYPWIDTNKFYIWEKQNYYLYVWRVIPYKKFDLIVDAFNKNWKKIIIATNTINSLQKKLEKKSNNNIVWFKNPKKEELYKFYAEAKCFLFPAEEDFWIVPIEAMASWTPVIAYNKWWAKETIINWVNWLFFESQSVRSLNNAIEEFETLEFAPENIRETSLKFDSENFKKNIYEFISSKINN